MARGDDSVNKAGPRVKVGGRMPRDPQFIFGTDEEIEDRDPNKSLYTEFLPNTNPPAFQQIKPEVSTGRSVNRSSYTRKGGDFKFSSGPGKPQIMATLNSVVHPKSPGKIGSPGARQLPRMMGMASQGPKAKAIRKRGRKQMGIDPGQMAGGGGPPGGPPGAGGPPGGAPGAGGGPDPMALLALAKLQRRKRHPGAKGKRGKRKK